RDPTLLSPYPTRRSSDLAGLYEMTPDQTGIVSAVPGAAGLHVIAGFSGHGFMHGPIAGQLMAEMLVHGRAATMDAAALDLARFADRKSTRLNSSHGSISY